MSYSHPYQKEFTNISFGPEDVFKTAIIPAACSGWFGIMQEDQEMPWAEADQRQLFTAGNTDPDSRAATVFGTAPQAGAKPHVTVEGKRTYRGALRWIVQNRQMFEEIFGYRDEQLDVPSSGFNTNTYFTGILQARERSTFTMMGWLDKAGDGFTESDDMAAQFIGCKFISATFNFTEGEELTIDTEVAATSSADATTIPVVWAEINTKPYLMQEGALTLLGGAYARIKSGSITLNHNTEEKWYAAVDPVDLIDKRLTMEATLTLVIDDDTIWDLLVAKPIAPTRLSVVFTRTAAEDLLTLESDITGTAEADSSAYPNYKPKFGGGEGEVEVEVVFKLNNFRAEVVDDVTTRHVY